VLWEEPPSRLNLWVTEASVNIDSFENAHIVFSRSFVNDHFQHGPPFTQISYSKFDDHGHVLIPELMLSDSTEDVANLPRLRFFGEDSLWVIWLAACENGMWPPFVAYRFRSMTLNGSFLGNERTWIDSILTSGLNYAFDIRADRTVIFAYVNNPYNDGIRMVVQRADGSRLMYRTMVWSCQACDRPVGFLDNTDSLQIIWREYPSWQACLTKRLATNIPYDTAHVTDYVALTPNQPGYVHNGGFLYPIADSLLVFTEQYDTSRWLSVTRMHVLRRANYTELASTLIGRDVRETVAVEGDSAVSMVCYSITSNTVYFRRYSVPSLVCTDSTLLFQQDVKPLGYAVSPHGVRHLVYRRRGADRVEHLCYRYWRSDLSVAERPSAPAAPAFSVSPNPVTTRFTLTGPLSSIRSLVFYNVLGQQVLSLTPQGMADGRADFPAVSALPSGVYFLKIDARQGSQVQKIVVGR
jgi:hypothetical protein